MVALIGGHLGAKYAPSCVWQSDTEKPAPEFAWSAQALNWMSQVRWAAAAKLTNVSPLTRKGRSALPEKVMESAAAPMGGEFVSGLVG